MADLNTLETVRTKLMARINQLDGQLKELRVKLHTIDGALGILFEEGGQKNGNNLIDLLKTDKFKGMKLSKAVLDCVNTYGETRELSPAEVRKILKDNGLQTKARNFYSTVFVALKRLSDRGIIERVEGKGFRKKQRIFTNEPENVRIPF